MPDEPTRDGFGPVGFETFKRQRLRPGAEPTVTVQKKGVLSINRLSFEALGEPEAVELLYDRDSKLIGMRKVEPSVEHAYMVRSLRGSATWLVSGRAFTNYYEIDVSVPRRRTATLDGDVLVVDLNDPGLVTTSNRDKSSKPRNSSAGQETLDSLESPNHSPGVPVPLVSRDGLGKALEKEGEAGVATPSRLPQT